MAKPPPVEYFRITTTVSKDKLGDTVSTLAKLGHQDVKFDLVTDIPAFAQRTGSYLKSENIFVDWLKDHPTFTAAEVVALFETHGVNQNGGYSTLYRAVAKKLVKKIDDGTYARIDKALQKSKEVKSKPAKPIKYAVAHTDFILRHARRNHGRFNLAGMKKLFVKDKRPGDSVSPTIDYMINRKLIERVGEGQYRIVKVVNKAADQAPVETKETANGND